MNTGWTDWSLQLESVLPHCSICCLLPWKRDLGRESPFCPVPSHDMGCYRTAQCLGHAHIAPDSVPSWLHTQLDPYGWYWGGRWQKCLLAAAGVARPAPTRLCSDAYGICLSDAWNDMILFPDLSNGRCHLPFVLQNLLPWLRQSQWVQIQWGKSLGISDGTNIHLFWLWLG